MQNPTIPTERFAVLGLSCPSKGGTGEGLLAATLRVELIQRT